MENNVKEKSGNQLNFDRVTECDWCGRKCEVSITHYGTSWYTRLICRDCANNVIERHKLLGLEEPEWFREGEELE